MEILQFVTKKSTISQPPKSMITLFFVVGTLHYTYFVIGSNNKVYNLNDVIGISLFEISK